MKKLLILIALLANFILSLGSSIDTPEYQYLKPFLKKNQQVVFNNLIKNFEFTLETLNKKINNSKDEKEKLKLIEEYEKVIKEKKKMITELNINILKYPERYTQAAINLNEDVKKLFISYSEVKK